MIKHATHGAIRLAVQAWWRAASSALLAALLLCACASPVGVRKTGFGPVFAERSGNVLTTGTLSEASQELLASLGMYAAYRSDPTATLAALETLALQMHRRGGYGALAELQYLRANKTGLPGDFLASAISAYLFLFCEELQPPSDPFDPRFRLACDIYNRAIARALLDESGAVNLKDQVVETRLGSLEIKVSRPGFPWGEKEFTRFLPADMFEVRGLRERVRTPGLGVPLIAVRNTDTDAAALTSGHLAAKLKLAATAVLELDGGLDALRARHIRGSLELYLATDVDKVTLSGHEVPLERDLTVALAYSLENAAIWGFSLEGFFGGSSRQFPPGIVLIQPYQRSKIPIVLVHGTASNPAEWTQLINGLSINEDLRRRYQVWVAIYNTGTPILLNAAEVRGALADLVAQLDPTGTDEAIKNMVVVGHSQGGLITRLLVTASGNRFWDHISSEPFDEYPLDDKARKLLRSSVFFEPLPFVKSVVFISTPHRGSFVAGGWIGNIARWLIELPLDVTSASMGLLKGDRLPAELRSGVPDSVANMKPDSMFVRVLDTLPFAPDVHLHSIVAVNGSGPVEDGDDGVVRYSSAHLEQAESEVIVRHGHSCQNEPQTILELRRILLELLGQIDATTKPTAGQ